jgi:hypothetical protein
MLLRPDGAEGPPDEALAIKAHIGDDFVTHACTEGTAATLQALDIQPRTVYDVIYSVAIAANTSFSCPYHAVQTCSGWRRRMWQELVISVLWFTSVIFVINAIGLSFSSACCSCRSSASSSSSWPTATPGRVR